MGEIMKENRYVATVSYYVYADSPRDAERKAIALCHSQREKYDNQCAIESIAEQPFGTLGSSKIELENPYF
jgi:hypothetical protein